MSPTDVVMVRVYCSDADHRHQQIVEWLHSAHALRGLTVFRGIAGFGGSGPMHDASLIDIRPDLPVVIEFFDQPDRVAAILPELRQLAGAGHIVSWPAQAYLE